MDIISSAWNKSLDLPVMDKLKMVKADLKTWNHQVFGNIEAKIVELETEIHKWDCMANIRSLSEEEVKLRSTSQLDMWVWLRKKEIY